MSVECERLAPKRLEALGAFSGIVVPPGCHCWQSRLSRRHQVLGQGVWFAVTGTNLWASTLKSPHVEQVAACLHDCVRGNVPPILTRRFAAFALHSGRRLFRQQYAVEEACRAWIKACNQPTSCSKLLLSDTCKMQPQCPCGLSCAIVSAMQDAGCV